MNHKGLPNALTLIYVYPNRSYIFTMTFTIFRTQTTPLVDFHDGHLVIEGKSVPFEHPDYYDTLQEKLQLYSTEHTKSTQIDIRLTAANAVSKRSIVGIFRFLSDLKESGISLQVNWYYGKDNEDIRELGEICRSTFGLWIDLFEQETNEKGR